MPINEKQHHTKMEGFHFFNGFLHHPSQVGSIIPSSKILKNHIIEMSGMTDARLVIELGPGTGGTTHSFLGAMPADARLLAIEINPDFVSLLNRMQDHRLTVHCGNASDIIEILKLYQLASADVIVSGIPFSSLPQAYGQLIVKDIAAVLRPGGRFLAYQFRDRVQILGNNIFGPADIEFELWNIPPLHLYCWQK